MSDCNVRRRHSSLGYLTPTEFETHHTNSRTRNQRLRCPRKPKHLSGYVGICAGAYLATADYTWSLDLVNAKAYTGSVKVDGKRHELWYRGRRSKVDVELTDLGQDVLDKPVPRLPVNYHNGPILSPAGRSDLPPMQTLAIFRTEVCAVDAQKGTMIDTSAVVAGRFGRGAALILSPHFESHGEYAPMITSAVAHAAAE